MDLGVLGGVALVDWLIIIYFLGFFVLGFAQGTIRRLIGLASILFSFLLAANLADPLGTFLANNWTDQSKQYSYMIGFLTVFVAASLAFAISCAPTSNAPRFLMDRFAGSVRDTALRSKTRSSGFPIRNVTRFSSSRKGSTLARFM